MKTIIVENKDKRIKLIFVGAGMGKYFVTFKDQKNKLHKHECTGFDDAAAKFKTTVNEYNKEGERLWYSQ